MWADRHEKGVRLLHHNKAELVAIAELEGYYNYLDRLYKNNKKYEKCCVLVQEL